MKGAYLVRNALRRVNLDGGPEMRGPLLLLREEIPKDELNEWGYPASKFWRFIGFRSGESWYSEKPRPEEEEE